MFNVEKTHNLIQYNCTRIRHVFFFIVLGLSKPFILRECLCPIFVNNMLWNSD